MDNYYFIYDPVNKQEYACTQEYYDKHRQDLLVIALGSMEELSEFFGNDFIIVDDN